MGTIESPANDNYTFGTQFNYSVWPKNTTVSLVTVPWNNDYRDIVRFPTREALNAYIDSRDNYGIVLSGVSTLKPNQPIRIPTPFNVALEYNYLRASAPVAPVPGDKAKDYYYFITNVTYIAPNTTELTLQLDVWQTFGYDVQFGNCYVEQGHIGIANQNNFRNYGRDFLTVPEGLDTGGEYQVISSSSKHIMGNGNGSPSGRQYNILAVSTVDLLATGNWGTRDNPNTPVAPGGMFGGLFSGASQYLFRDADSFRTWLTGMADKPWITQGIISLTMIPPVDLYGFSVPNDNNPHLFNANPTAWRSYVMKSNWRDAQEIKSYIPARYQGLRKFWTYPYMVVELTTFTGTPILLKPESWADRDATLREFTNLVQPGQRIAISPYKYNSSGAPDNGRDDNGEFLDIATYIHNFPTLAIVNNMALNYLASNAHSIAFQYQSADWAQQRALMGNQTAFDQASSGMNTLADLTSISNRASAAQTANSNNLAMQKTFLGMGGDVVGGAGGGAAVGGPAGAAAGIAGGLGAAITRGIGTNMDISASVQSNTISQNAASASTNRSNDNAGYVRDTNKNLADWSARGDYQNSIAAVNAKVQDSRTIQPSTSGQVGGDAFNIVNDIVMVSARFKMIDQAAIRRIGEYWLRYGYAIRQFVTPPVDMMVMSKFTYWKMQETYLIASKMPEGMKQIIRGIFEKGVTVWRNPDDIGRVDIADNTPIGGIAL